METINKEYFHTKDAEVKKKKSKLPTLEAIILGRTNVIKDKGAGEPPLPNNMIRYEASEKLTETTSDKSSGLHTGKFGTTIVSHTFENGVGTIEFEDDVTTIGGYAFYGCGLMTSITIPSSVTSIGGNAFESCKRLLSIIIPNSVMSIGIAAFRYCSGLTEVTIPNSVTSIDTNTFYDCSGLTSMTIEAITPPTLGSSVFSSSTSGIKIYVPSASVDAYKAASGWSTYADRIQAIQ